jgi:hypothetical protein
MRVPEGDPPLSLSALPTREQLADKLWSESCGELARIRDMLAPAFARHQKAIDETAKHGRDNNYQRGMGPLLTEAWREFQVKQQVEKERTAARA